MGIVKAVCISPRRGTEKQNIGHCRLVTAFGLEGDAHGGNWHRQVSLLSDEKIQQFNARGAGVEYGAFGENLVVSGFDFAALPVGSILTSGEVVLEITQIGKECHQHCTIYQRMGECIMPVEGVFARVLRGGELAVGDEMTLVSPNGFTAAVITASDKGFAGERVDESGPLASAILKSAGYQVTQTRLLPDDRTQLEEALRELADDEKVSLIITTGGTGFSPRDVTPEATMAVAERVAPGIAEAIRLHSLSITPRAMLGRGVSVLRGKTLIVNLPGSKKAVAESLDWVVGELYHGLAILTGRETEHHAK